jgi:flavin reductase (DIM6/NTAB) family NADH-FMN oxidoreductase RutF
MTLTAEGLPSPVDVDKFRSVMGTVCQHVSVVSANSVDGRPHGTTVTAFCSLSLRPPMISVALDRNSRLLARLIHTRRLGISLLSDRQHLIAEKFATKSDNKADCSAWIERDDLPYIDGAAGWLTCEVTEFVAGGDHIALFCLVTSVIHSDRNPLVYSHRRYGTNSGLLEMIGKT